MTESQGPETEVSSGGPEAEKALRERLARAEEVVEALEGEEVDAVVLKKGVSLLRLRDAERSLRESEEQLRLAKKAAQLGVHDYDLLSGRIRWDERVYELWGLEDGHRITYDYLLSTVHPDDREIVQASLDRAFEPSGDGQYHAEFRITRANDGSMRWIAATGQVLFEDGRAVRLIGTAHDITDRKIREEKLRQSHRRLELLAATAGELLRSLDPRSAVERVCRKAMEILDCDTYLNYLLDRPSAQLQLNASSGIRITEENKCMVLGSGIDGRAARDGQRIIKDHMHGKGDPHGKQVERHALKAYACHPLVGPDGAILGTLSFGTRTGEAFSADDLSLMQAIADHVAVAVSRINTEAALRESQCDDMNRAQGVAHVGSWRLYVKNNVLVCSDENHRLFGIPKGMSMTHETVLDKVHPDDRDHVRSRWLKDLQKGCYEVEYRIMVDGAVKWVYEKAHNEYDETGEVVSIFGTTQDVTAFKEAADALARERHLLQQIVNNIPVMLVIWDAQIQQFILNSKAEELLGWSTSEANEIDFMAKVYPDPKYRAKVKQFMQALEPVWYQWNATARDGTVIPTEWTNVALTDNTMIGIGIDLRERMAAEKALRQGEAQLRKAMMAGRIFSFEWDPQTDMTYRSDTCLHVLRLDVSEGTRTTGQEHIAHIPKQDREDLARTINSLTPENCEYEITYRYQLDDGGIIWLEETARAEFDEGGRMTRIAGIVADATDSVQAKKQETMAVAAQAALDTVNAMGEGVVFLDPRMRIRNVNPAFTSLVGQGPQDLEGRDLREVLPEVMAEEATVIDKTIARVAIKRKKGDANDALSIATDSGDYRWVVPTLSHILGEDHEPIAAVLTLRDVTELIEAQDNLLESERKYRELVENANSMIIRIKEILCVGADATARKRLEAEMEAHRRRLGDLADRLIASEEETRRKLSTHLHDSVIQGLSLANMRLGGLRAGVDEVGMTASCREIDQIRQIVQEGIEECRRVMSTLTPPLLYELGLSPALQELAQKQSRRHHVNIRVEAEDGEPYLDDAKKGLLYHSAGELIMNAVKHAGSSEIFVRIFSDDGEVCVEVSDKGKGFDVKAAQAANCGDNGGFGLFNIRERLLGIGGQLEIWSAPGEGTEVCIRVPWEDEFSSQTDVP